MWILYDVTFSEYANRIWVVALLRMPPGRSQKFHIQRFVFTGIWWIWMLILPDMTPTFEKKHTIWAGSPTMKLKGGFSHHPRAHCHASPESFRQPKRIEVPVGLICEVRKNRFIAFCNSFENRASFLNLPSFKSSQTNSSWVLLVQNKLLQFADILNHFWMYQKNPKSNSSLKTS